MSGKSHVSLEQYQCVVCGCTYDTGAVLLHKQLAQKLEQHTLTGYGLCPEHQKLFDEGYVALVEVDPELSCFGPDGNLTAKTAHCTGTIVHILREVFNRIFTPPLDDDEPLAYTEPAVIALLKEHCGHDHKH